MGLITLKNKSGLTQTLKFVRENRANFVCLIMGLETILPKKNWNRL